MIKERVKMLDEYKLKPLEEADLNIVFKWRNSNRIKQYMYTDHTITWEEHRKWFIKVKQDETTKIFLLHFHNQPLGLVNFKQIDLNNSRCYWGFYIGEENAPKGAGTIMGLLALDHIFYEVGLQKVCAEVIETNERSYFYHQKLGFETEGKFKEHLWKDERFVDVISMALFVNKWDIVRKRLLQKMKGD